MVPWRTSKAFGRDVLDGKITPPRAEQYSAALVIGIGGSALGPELVADAIPAAGLDMFFLDNTDPDGMYRVLESLPLEETLVVVISKSGGTPETRNGMLVAQDFFRKNGLELLPRRSPSRERVPGWTKRLRRKAGSSASRWKTGGRPHLRHVRGGAGSRRASGRERG